MKKLSSYIQLRKEYSVGGQAWAAYWRGTANRVQTIAGDAVPRRYKQRDLKFDLLNNPMEAAVVIETIDKQSEAQQVKSEGRA